MQTNLSESARQLARSDEAESILRSCVHCGFCNATCPTYQITGDELDGPRGRIYLIKQLLEGEAAGKDTQEHLDRCLSCRNCETTCPSGVEYHSLLDIARPEAERQAPPRPAGNQLTRWGLRFIMTRPSLFHFLFRLGQFTRALLPAQLKSKVPAYIPPARPYPKHFHQRQVILLDGCVQPTLSPNTNAATARVLDRLNITGCSADGVGCCGAVDYHLNAQTEGLARAKRNIDSWIDELDAGAESIIPTASGCGAFIKEYAHLLKDDPDYAAKARRVSEHTMDLSELLSREQLDSIKLPQRQRIVFQCPCTLQHGQKLAGTTEELLTRIGFDLNPVQDSHLCCGSAGTYSITQPELATQLRDNKLDNLERDRPIIIATANIGCQVHLNSAERTPVRHWIELIDDALTRKEPTR